jgi:hypothetical protein
MTTGRINQMTPTTNNQQRTIWITIFLITKSLVSANRDREMLISLPTYFEVEILGIRERKRLI